VIRATLDVNVLASGFPAEAGIPAALIDRWTDLAYELVISEHILDGLIRTWRKPYYQRRYSPGRIQQALSLLRTEATLVVPVATVRGVAADEEDDLVLATAIAGDVGFLVTGDRYLQGLGQYQNVVILPPRQFLEVLADDAGDAT
jgi:putative PIN family toxin of toxin-antitoxin system